VQLVTIYLILLAIQFAQMIHIPAQQQHVLFAIHHVLPALLVHLIALLATVDIF